MESVDGDNASDMARKHEMAFQSFSHTMTLIHSQIADINRRLDAQDKSVMTESRVIVSHRGLGSVPQLASPVPSETGAGNAMTQYDGKRA